MSFPLLCRKLSMAERNARIGLRLFFVYLLFYGGFVLTAALRPAAMEATPAAGVNLAVWWGFALIIAALVMAVLYGWLCRSPREENGGRRG